MIRASRLHSGLDAAETQTLRDLAAGAEGAVGVTGEASVPINRLGRAYWQSGEPDAELYEVSFNVTQINTSGGATYDLTAYSSATSGGARTELGRIPNVKAVGAYSLTIDSDQLGTSANFVAVGVEISAATPRSITYGATLKKAGTKVKKSAARAHATSSISSTGTLKPRRTTK